MCIFKNKENHIYKNTTITFKAQFEVFHGVRVGTPKNLKYNEWFRCDFSTGIHFHPCQITYLGSDEIMQENTWYDCEITILAIGNLPPFDPESKFENIEFEKEYWLHAGFDVVGKCKLLSIIRVED